MSHALRLALVPVALLAVSPGPVGQGATVSGGVTDAATGRNLSGVVVDFSPRLSTVTDPKGSFTLGGVAPGAYSVRVSHGGYRSKLLHVTVERRDHEMYLVVVLVPLVVEGDSAALRTDTTSVIAYPPYIGFYRRRHAGNGYFFTRRDIERLQPDRTTDLLRSIPGAWFTYDRRGQVYVSFHLGPNARQGCQPAIYLDGTRAGSMMSLDGLVHPGRIEAMEVYSGLPLKPMAFPEACVIAVWTR
jgi:hypothetical protein